MATSTLKPAPTWAIRTPATTANMGPGFDVIGMALGLYNELQIQRACCRASSSIQVFGEGSPASADPRDNLIFRTYEKTCAELGLNAPHVRIQCLNRIPFARGLGSSSAAIVSGVLMAQIIHDRPMAKEDILDLITRFDGHPDNVLPCLLGGAVVSAQDAQGQLFYEKVEVHPSIRAYVYVPDKEMHTQEARTVLPDTYSRQDVVHNLGRLAILTQALAKGHVHNLKRAMTDRLHEPYRYPFMPGLQAVADQARSMDHWGLALSGSGPSLLILGPGDADWTPLLDTGRTHGLEGQILDLKPLTTGARAYADGLEIDLWH